MAARHLPQALGYRPLEYWKAPKAVHFPAEGGRAAAPGHQQRTREVKAAQLVNDTAQGAGRSPVGAIEVVRWTGAIEKEAGGSLLPASTHRVPRSSTTSDKDDKMSRTYYKAETPRWYHVRRWRKRTWAVVVGVVIAAVVIAVVVPVLLVVRKAQGPPSYPSYVKLNYSLAETCK